MIVVVVRTRNEEANIGRFLSAYVWADRVLVADGGSTDRTVEIARGFHNAEVREFSERIYASDGKTWHNPDGKHLNFLLDWANDYHPAWVIADDCDSVPNLRLRDTARQFLTTTRWDAVFVRRLFLWYDGRYFPQLDVGETMWAWRPGLGIRADPASDFHPNLAPIPDVRELKWHLGNLYRLIHRPWRDEKQIERKMAMYRAFGLPMRHPLETCGELKELPEWARTF